MGGWLYRFEGVNIGAYVLDTNDLCTIRGASLALLNGVELFLEKAEDKISCWSGAKLEKISTGASIGLFHVHGIQADEAAALCGELEKFVPGLKGGNGTLAAALKHATFVIDMTQLDDPSDKSAFIEARDRLVALNRLKQLQTSTFPPPASGKMDYGVCSLDRVSPALEEKKEFKGEPRRVSQRSWDRRQYGFKQKKQDFYDKRIGAENGELLEDLGFAHSFHDICETPGDVSGMGRLRPQLEGKIAVLYADGNSFGKTQQELIERGENAIGTTREFDKSVQDWRVDFLAECLRQLAHKNAIGEEGVGKRKHEYYRMETLLWGGDEFQLVLPARLGFEIAEMFLERAQACKAGGKSLFHACSLVFCHKTAPIREIVSLSRSLADDICKARIDEDDGRKGNLLSVAVLESFDMVLDDVPSWLQGTLAPFAEPERVDLLRYNLHEVTALRKAARAWMTDDGLSRRRLHKIGMAVGSASGKADGHDWSHWVDKAADDITDKNAATFQPLAQNGQGDEQTQDEDRERERAMWAALAWMYDYLAPVTEDSSETGQEVST